MKSTVRTRLLAVVRSPLSKVAALFFVLGIVFWGGFNTALESTNTTEFCIGCHEMRDNAFKEYTQTVHYLNRTGVRAGCPDCHVPKDWVHKMARKIEASGELWGAFRGVINTPEKYEARRYTMATHVWRRMVTSDSIECRNCHDMSSMSLEKQTEKAQRRHAKGQAEGKTCIECHFGIAHKEPVGEEGPTELKARLMSNN